MGLVINDASKRNFIDLFINRSIDRKLLVTNINNISNTKEQNGRHIQNDFGFDSAMTTSENTSRGLCLLHLV